MFVRTSYLLTIMNADMFHRFSSLKTNLLSVVFFVIRLLPL